MSHFEDNIKKWVLIDNKIKSLINEIKLLREEKSIIKDDIYTYINDNELSNAVIKISDGKLKFNKYKISKPLTFKYIEQCLSRCINDLETNKKIMNYIKNSRESKYIDDIKRLYD